MNDTNATNNQLESKEFKLLLNLLEKAEQILSIINLPDSSISKYNTLKKMTFDMLSMPFTPLEKKCIPPSNVESQNNASDESLYLLHFLNIKKSMLIDLILNYIMSIDNNNEPNKDLNYFLNSLTQIYNLSGDTIASKTPNDIFNEAKMEDSKLAGLFTKIDNTLMNNFEKIKNMKKNYENELNRLKQDYNMDLDEFKNNLEKNSYLESDLCKLKKENESNYFYLNKISLLINQSYEKFREIFPNEIDEKNIIYNYPNFDGDIMKLEFIKNSADKLHNNNGNYQLNGNNKNRFNYQYDEINPNNYDRDELKNLLTFLPEIQKESDIFHKNFIDLMNYIETNIEGKIV